jgi:hypothetical protein
MVLNALPVEATPRLNRPLACFTNNVLVVFNANPNNAWNLSGFFRS